MSQYYPFQIGLTANGSFYSLDGKAYNGKTLPAIKYQGAKYSRQAVDSGATGRNQDGNMIREMVNTKDKWELEFVPCTQAQLGALLGILDNQYFYFRYPDPLYGSGVTGHTSKIITKQCYCGDRSAPVWLTEQSNSSNRGVAMWGNLTFNIIEV